MYLSYSLGQLCGELWGICTFLQVWVNSIYFLIINLKKFHSSADAENITSSIIQMYQGRKLCIQYFSFLSMSRKRGENIVKYRQKFFRLSRSAEVTIYFYSWLYVCRWKSWFSVGLQLYFSFPPRVSQKLTLYQRNGWLCFTHVLNQVQQPLHFSKGICWFYCVILC